MVFHDKTFYLRPTFREMSCSPNRFLVREIAFDDRLNTKNFLPLLSEHFCVPRNFRIMIKATGYIRRDFKKSNEKVNTFSLREIL